MACSDATRDINDSCNCKDTFYNDGTDPVCKACVYPCTNCTSPTVCVTCYDSVNRNIKPVCDCANGSYLNS